MDTPTHTPTPTTTGTPTSTPSPNQTPEGTPVGGVSEIVPLNSAACVAGSVAFEGVTVVDAANSCASLSWQSSLQILVGCLRAIDVDMDAVAQCFEGVTADDEVNALLLPQPADFAAIDHDGDQIRLGQHLLVMAFVEGDWPVLFEASNGMFQHAGGTSSSYLCNAVDADPDCDGDPSTVGDGVVVAQLVVGPDEPLGDSTVTVTQAFGGETAGFTIVGAPKRIELEVFGGKDLITTGAGDCDDLALPWDFDELVDLAENGIADDARTVILTRVFDAEGTALANALLNWEPSWEGVANRSGGGSALSVFTMELGLSGFAGVQVVCGRDVPGTVESLATLETLLDGAADPLASAEIVIEVVDELPTVTPTPTETSTSTSTPTPTPTLDPSVPTATATRQQYVTVTPTPSATSTIQASATATPTPSTTSTTEPTSTSTAVPTATETATATATTEAPNETATPVASKTVQATSPTVQTTPTVAVSTSTPVPTATNTVSPTATATTTATPSVTPTVGAIASATSTPRATRTPSSSRNTRTPMASRTAVVASQTVAVSTAAPVSTVLGTQATPPPVGVTLPDTGDGGSGDGGTGLTAGVVLLIALAGGAAVVMRRRV